MPWVEDRMESGKISTHFPKIMRVLLFGLMTFDVVLLFYNLGFVDFMGSFKYYTIWGVFGTFVTFGFGAYVTVFKTRD